MQKVQRFEKCAKVTGSDLIEENWFQITSLVIFQDLLSYNQMAHQPGGFLVQLVQRHCTNLKFAHVNWQ